LRILDCGLRIERSAPLRGGRIPIRNPQSAIRNFLSVFLLPLSFLHAGPPSPAAQDWKEIVALDAGPTQTPKNQAEALQLTRQQLLAQQKLLVEFLRKYPRDPQAFNARLRLTNIEASLASLDGNRRGLEQALAKFSELERTNGIPRSEAAEAGFRKVSLLFYLARGREAEMRDAIVTAAANYHTRYISDPRGPRVLVEAATICDSAPDTKRDLLETALRDTQEDGLRQRITDDLRRLDFLGRKPELKFTATNGQAFDLGKERGHPTVVVFWSADSPHSLVWMKEFVSSTEKLPKNACKIVTVSLDKDRKTLDEMSKELGLTYPTHFDGKGWENAISKPLGINAVPTVWIFDKGGRLRTLNARQNYLAAIQQLTAE